MASAAGIIGLIVRRRWAALTLIAVSWCRPAALMVKWSRWDTLAEFDIRLDGVEVDGAPITSGSGHADDFRLWEAELAVIDG